MTTDPRVRMGGPVCPEGCCVGIADSELGGPVDSVHARPMFQVIPEGVFSRVRREHTFVAADLDDPEVSVR